MASSYKMIFQVSCCVFPNQRPSIPQYTTHRVSKASVFPDVKPLMRELRAADHIRVGVSTALKESMLNILDAFVDSVFEFVDEPLLRSQSNFAPVDEVRELVLISDIKGNIPSSFPRGVYVRNGANPQFGGQKSTKSVFGKSNYYWVEGEGMLHGLYFDRDSNDNLTVHYNNRFIETDTFKQEKLKKKPSFIPFTQGDVPAIIIASLLNLLRFGKVKKNISNTNVFMHSGKCYSIAENDLPQEINASNLETLGIWDMVSQDWNRNFTSHPKIDPVTGELVIIGIDAIKPYMELGIISADGKRLVHRADLKLDRCTFNHDIGITERYNVIMDFPLTLDLMRLLRGDSLLKFDREEYAKIGVMPRFGQADSIKWFEVEPSCTFHIFNCFEYGNDEVILWGCRALESIIPGPGQENFDASVRDGLLYDRPYEWRLNMRSGEIKERNLTLDTELSMDFPMINANFTGLKTKFGYAHVVDTEASASANHMPKFGGLAKLHFEDQNEKSSSAIRVEYHMFDENIYCTGSTFVPKQDGFEEEDDGWILTFVHNESTNTSQVFVIDAKVFSGEPIAKITLPRRVPYGFHGVFIPAAASV